MFKKIYNWLRRKAFGLKHGLDIELIGTVAMIRVDCGYMPRSKAIEHAHEYGKIFTEEVKKSMGISHYIMIPYNRG